MAAEPGLLSTVEAAEVLGVQPAMIRRLVRAGDLSAHRGGGGRLFFRRADLDAYLLGRPHTPGSWGTFQPGRSNGRKTDGREWLEALTAAGWSDERICAEVGMLPKTLARSREHGVATPHRTRVRELAERTNDVGSVTVE